MSSNKAELLASNVSNNNRPIKHTPLRVDFPINHLHWNVMLANDTQVACRPNFKNKSEGGSRGKNDSLVALSLSVLPFRKCFGISVKFLFLKSNSSPHLHSSCHFILVLNDPWLSHYFLYRPSSTHQLDQLALCVIAAGQWSFGRRLTSFPPAPAIQTWSEFDWKSCTSRKTFDQSVGGVQRMNNATTQLISHSTRLIVNELVVVGQTN